jgi:hypothetical protein
MGFDAYSQPEAEKLIMDEFHIEDMKFLSVRDA